MSAADHPAEVIKETIVRVLREGGREDPAIADDDLLRESLDLDSMDLAVIVVRLEQQLGVDPFRTRRTPVHTVADLIAQYQQSLSQTE